MYLGVLAIPKLSDNNNIKVIISIKKYKKVVYKPGFTIETVNPLMDKNTNAITDAPLYERTEQLIDGLQWNGRRMTGMTRQGKWLWRLPSYTTRIQQKAVEYDVLILSTSEKKLQQINLHKLVF